MIAIARGIRRFDGRSTFSTWSYRVATNACLDELRRRRRRPVPGALGTPAADGDGSHVAGTSVVDRLDPGGRGTGAALVGGRSPSSDGGIGGIADRLELDDALAHLPEDFRLAVVLRDLCDLDYVEIGRVLDLRPGTVRSRIARGRALLTDLLGNPAPSPDRPTTRP